MYGKHFDTTYRRSCTTHGTLVAKPLMVVLSRVQAIKMWLQVIILHVDYEGVVEGSENGVREVMRMVYVR